jgi:antirestriction protein ArdC
VVFWKELEGKDKQTGEPTKIPMMRYYRVFNLEQTEGITIPDVVPFTPSIHTPIEAAEDLVRGYTGAPPIIHEGAQAFWRPKTDTIHIPEPTRFTGSDEYYSTLFHECAHSTGHSTRLDRKLDTDPKPFGSTDYGKEELVAEMAAAFLCGHCQITPRVIENQAAYLQGWLKTIKADKKLVVSAASAAQKAADWIKGERAEQVT